MIFRLTTLGGAILLYFKAIVRMNVFRTQICRSIMIPFNNQHALLRLVDKNSVRNLVILPNRFRTVEPNKKSVSQLPRRMQLQSTALPLTYDIFSPHTRSIVKTIKVFYISLAHLSAYMLLRIITPVHVNKPGLRSSAKQVYIYLSWRILPRRPGWGTGKGSDA